MVWTWRLMRSNIIFPEALEDWNLKNLEDSHGDFIYIHSCWMFVLPFFVSRGYAMYQQDPIGLGNLNPPPFPPAAKATSYPYSRQLPSKTPIPRATWAPRIWAARDALGRDVIIKVISEVDNPSNELKVMQLLNSKRLRSDPANHTIYAIEYITFDKFVFVVMPRWDSAIEPEFSNVSELMHLTKIILEAFGFLHRNRIVHLDCLAQNMGMNAVMTTAEIYRRTGVRDPKEVRYALFDFDAAVIFPEDTVIEEARMDHVLSFDRHWVPAESITYPYNPFRVDVAFMGTCLQTFVSHLESKIPEPGPFFDSLIDINDPNQPSASQALSRFTDISNNLTPEVASASFDGFIWRQGEAPLTTSDEGMEPSYKVRYRGFEAWLKHCYKGDCQMLSTEPVIDEDLQTVTASVNLEPKTPFVLLWRRADGQRPVSALCQVFIRNGYYRMETEDFCVAVVTMDKTRQKSQNMRTTYGYHNLPYKIKGCLKAGRLCDYSAGTCPYSAAEQAKSPCSLRLEIRRIRGKVAEPEWVVGPDRQQYKKNNADLMNIIDDEKQNMLPFATFVFEIPVPEEDGGNIPPTIWAEEDTIYSRPPPTGITANAHVLITRSLREDSSGGRYPTPRSPNIIEINNNDVEPMPLDGSKSGTAHPQDRKPKKELKEEKQNRTQFVDTMVVRIDSNRMDVLTDYLATDRLEKELAGKLQEKIKVKKKKIKHMKRLLAAD
ncbi:hypothetical protein JR316_0003093 [Psilocybe cubensis]|uniref:Protein kinase domain-containing protein n=2 Tax=Psilocybe cubensis TaxID=181762 RepID=A0A8H8CMT7_PSICU|nr:hypothetical protein JR316_0003093 [Psilocybe cubensis]KAH9483623.1 hypothetical protein JR316_0003093 [Psilocybe cubensis]